MSRLLISESPLQVLPSLATAIGLNQAIFLQQLHYWISHPEAPKRDGHSWHYESVTQWREQFPFWVHRTIQRIIERIAKANLIITKQYEAKEGDQRNWYTINYPELQKLESSFISKSTGRVHYDKMSQIEGETPDTLRQNVVDPTTKCRNVYKEKEIKKEIKNDRSKSDPIVFSDFEKRMLEKSYNMVTQNDLKQWIRKYSEQEIESAIQITNDNEPHTNYPGYVNSILKINAKTANAPKKPVEAPKEEQVSTIRHEVKSPVQRTTKPNRGVPSIEEVENKIKEDRILESKARKLLADAGIVEPPMSNFTDYCNFHRLLSNQVECMRRMQG